MNQLVLLAKALTDPSRVRVLALLREQELCVCEICDVLGLTQSTLSTHLQVIRKAGLVSARKEGKWMYYAISPDAKPIVRSLFKAFAPSLKGDATLRQDGKKLTRRLAMRENGSCCVGFANSKCCSEKARK